MQPPRRVVPVLTVCLAAAAWLCACRPSADGDAEAALPRFFEAVQASDLDALYCLVAWAAVGGDDGGPVPRDAFERWALARYQAYLDGRDSGRVDLDGSGVAEVQLFQLGRGTFYTEEGREPAGEDGVRLRTRLRFGYDKVDLSRLPAGTTFYLSGAPAGTIHAARIPRGGGEISVEALDSIDLEWSLIRLPATGEAGAPGDSGPPGCGDRWAVAGVEPVDGTASTRQVTWIF